MADASYAQTSFLGGEWSKAMQGRIDRPDYRTAMNVCLNAMPMEQGAWTRRPGTRHCGPTRNGNPGRVVNFDFKQAAPYTIEFTDGYLRFWSAFTLVNTNDAQTVTSISTASPAVVTTGTHGWSTGNQVRFSALGANNPLLQNRDFAITVLSATTFSIADALTATSIDGSTLGTFVSGKVNRTLEIAAPYVGGSWANTRVVQTDLPDRSSQTIVGAVLLNAAYKPYLLQVATLPTATAFATFTLAAASFKDGPYFDPVTGGTLATPSATIGNVTITLSFAAYDATKSYSIGDYAVSASVNYKSLTDANVGNVPAGSPTNWAAVSAADAIGPNGFTGNDVGRHIRFYSEPAVWAVGTAYVVGNVVAYGGTYYKCLSNNTGNTPNTAPTLWAVFPTGAIWTWGKITGLSNIIDRALAGSASIGDMTAGGGLAAAVDGNLSQAASACAEKTSTGTNTKSTALTLTSYVGKNYSGASDQKIAQATVYPSNDFGLAAASVGGNIYTPTVTINLRGKASLPASSSDGTLIGTTGSIANTSAPVTIVSTDQATSWKYVWVELTAVVTVPGGAYTFTNCIGELSLFNPPGSGTSQGVTVQVVGDALLYTTAVRIWRLGVYSDTVGWPACGTYHEGRLWLSGVVGNRIDSSKSNDIFNFAPTDATGLVAGNNAISYTFNAPDVNPIFWMEPDDRGIVCGTQAGEWLVQATTANLPLTPTSIQAHRVTRYKCANIEPRRTGLTLAVVQAFKRKILEFFADVYSSRFTAHNLALTAKHLTAPGIREIAYQHELIPTLWARMADGSLIGATYKRESLVSSQPPEFAGWHRHTLGSGRTVESITVAANVDGTLDALAMVSNDAATAVRHVEMLTDVMEETVALGASWLLDDAIVPASTSTTNAASAGAPYGSLTINGLWYLNGKTVSVFAGGLDCGDFTVASGAVTVPYGDSVSAGTGSGLFTPAFAAAAVTAGQVVVGFTYNSDGQVVRPATPAESGARTGPALGKTRRHHMYGLQVAGTGALSIGTDFSKLYAVQFKTAGTNLAVGSAYTGVTWDSIRDDYSFDSMLCWRASRPLPALVASVAGFLHTMDR